MFTVQTKKGFTLIELIVAISIIAVMATIGFVLYGGTQKVSRDSKRMGDMKEVQKALEQYYALNKGYPALSTAGSNTTIKNLTALNNFFQLNVPPSDPNLGGVNDYEYKYYTCGGGATLATNYMICAKLENPKGNMDNASVPPTDGCSNIVSGSNNIYYCLKGLSN